MGNPTIMTGLSAKAEYQPSTFKGWSYYGCSGEVEMKPLHLIQDRALNYLINSGDCKIHYS